MCEYFAQLHSTRQRLRDVARCLQSCADHDVPETYHTLLKTAEQLFGTEQQLMEDYDFPARQTHLEQHARVLRGLHRVHAAVLLGAIDQARDIGGRLLMDWLKLHEDTVDAAFTVWANYCDYGLIELSKPPSHYAITAH